MHASVSDITINRLTVKGSREDSHSLAHYLETRSWPDTNSNEWLFIRKLSVKGQLSSLSQQAAQSMTDARRYAIDGGSSAASQANAVRFSSLPHMIAFLLRDIVGGTASIRWYWQRWQALLKEPKSVAVARLMWDHADFLPDIIALHSESQLEKLWLTLDSESAEQIAKQLAKRLGYLSAENITPTLTLREKLGSSESLNTASIHNINTSQTYADIVKSVHRIPGELMRWSRIIRHLRPQDGRTLLAATITGIHYFPMLLAKHQQQFTEVFYTSVKNISLAETFKQVNRAQPTQSQQASSPDIDLTSSSLDNQANESRFTHTDDTKNTLINLDSDHQKTDTTKRQLPIQGSVANSTPPDNTDADQTCLNREAYRNDQAITTNTHKNSVESHTDLPSGFIVSEGQFYTACGGVFYLINLIIPFVERLLDKTNTNEPGSGFRWLFELLRRFPASEAGDKINPFMQKQSVQEHLLLNYFALQMGFENTEQLLNCEPLPVFDEIFNQLEQSYSNIWNIELLYNPAVVMFTSTHVDVFLPINAIRVDVRLHGLDVNPGWQPWLGRVVLFHYRQSIDDQGDKK